MGAESFPDLIKFDEWVDYLIIFAFALMTFLGLAMRDLYAVAKRNQIKQQSLFNEDPEFPLYDTGKFDEYAFRESTKNKRN